MAHLKPHQRKDGTIAWRVRFRLTPNTNPVTETFDTHDAATRFIDLINTVGPIEARRVRDATTTHPHGLTLAAAFAEYLTHVGTYAEKDTTHRYRIVATNSWLPHLGDYPIHALTRDHVTQWLATQRVTPTRRGTPPATKTLKNAHGILSSTLQHQVDKGVLDKNVAKGIRLPRQTTATRPHVYLTTTQFTAICAHLDGLNLFLARLLYATGMRFSEATALTPGDFMLTTTPATVRVWRAWKRTPTGQELGLPKTRKSTRTITLPDTFTTEAKQALTGLPRTAHIFVDNTGEAITSTNWRKQVWYPACKKANVDPTPTIHDLRHTHASELIKAGIPLPVIQDRLGHESIQTTVDTYGHLTTDSMNLAASAIDNALTRNALSNA